MKANRSHRSSEKIFESPVFGRVPEPQNLDEFLLACSPTIKGEHFNVHMWRGQADIAWPIHSGAFRRLRLSKDNPTESDVVHYEQRLLKKAWHQGLNVHEGRHLSDFELLARLQHHGAATRLLDATRNCLVALYFAAESHPDKHGLVAGFHSSHLGGGEGNPESRPYGDVVKELPSHHHPQTWDSPVITPRIASQHSQFLYSAVGDDLRGSIRIAKAEHSLLTIAISPKFKVSALKFLPELFDIRHSTLFPDVYGFCHINSTKFREFDHERW